MELLQLKNQDATDLIERNLTVSDNLPDSYLKSTSKEAGGAAKIRIKIKLTYKQT